MATTSKKKSAATDETAETEEKAFSVGVSSGYEVIDTEEETEAAEPEITEEAEEEPATYMYIGPSIHGYITTNTMFSGTKAEREAQLTRQLEKYPDIRYLLVPVDENLSIRRREVHQAGTLLNHKAAGLAKKI